MYKRLMVYSDGGARGNPGPAAAACLVTAESGEVLVAKSRYLGVRTNNQAEYEALMMALDAALALGAEEVVCHLDSELVAKQLRGEYAVKNRELRQLCSRVQEKVKRFKLVSFVNMPRTNSKIQKADELVNEALDAAAGKTRKT
ncbi:MAG: ribonuclease HI family protein [Candidatus Bathyarchaeota archaeon]|nr:ribonuclease HI family protein [Candidatus Bathyarchaeota archaeon]